MNRSIAGLILLASTLWVASCESSLLAPVVPNTATVRGTLTGGGRITFPSAPGQPLEGFTVTIDGRSATTAANGSYRLVEIDVGNHAYEIQNPQGYVCVSWSIDVVAPETVRDLQLVTHSSGGLWCEDISCFDPTEWDLACVP